MTSASPTRSASIAARASWQVQPSDDRLDENVEHALNGCQHVFDARMTAAADGHQPGAANVDRQPITLWTA